MTFSSLKTFLRPPVGGAKTWQEPDIKHFIERYLRQQLKTEALYCEGVRNHQATISVGSPTLLQAVRLHEFDLTDQLKTEANYTLKGVTVVQRW